MNCITYTEAIKLYNFSLTRKLAHYEMSLFSTWGKQTMDYYFSFKDEDESNLECIVQVVSSDDLYIVFSALSSCTCCQRHMMNRPILIDDSDNVSLIECNECSFICDHYCKGGEHCQCHDLCDCRCRQDLHLLRKAYFYKYGILSQLDKSPKCKIMKWSSHFERYIL